MLVFLRLLPMTSHQHEKGAPLILTPLQHFLNADFFIVAFLPSIRWYVIVI